MRILYDGRVFQMQRVGGVNRYFAEIISGLPGDYHPVITGVADFGRNVPSHPNLEQPRFKHFRPGRISVRVREPWWKPRRTEALRASSFRDGSGVVKAKGSLNQVSAALVCQNTFRLQLSVAKIRMKARVKLLLRRIRK